MDRRKAAEEARHAAWGEAEDVPDRIERLRRVSAEFPEDMIALSDIAVSQLRTGDVGGAVRTYREIVDRWDSFDTVWDNVLGLAYMFAGDAPRAIETFEGSRAHSWEQGLHRALAYLMDGQREAFEERFDEWVSEDLRRTYELHQHEDVMGALLSEEDAAYVGRLWDEYHDGYERMSHYERYLTFRGQHLKSIGMAETDDGRVVQLEEDEDWWEDDEEDEDRDPEGDGEGDDFWDWQPRIPRRLSEDEFYALMREYLYLDHKAHFDDVDDDEWERHEELSDLLHAYATID